VFYILHGDDEFSRAEQLAATRNKLADGDRSMADLNTSILNGNRCTIGELRHACDAVPFLAEHRLVIVEGLLTRLEPSRHRRRSGQGEQETPEWKKKYLGELRDYLPNLPPSTMLVFLEDEGLPAAHPIVRLANQAAKEDGAFVKRYDRPKTGELSGWIRRRVAQREGAIEGDAATLLAALVGQDLRLLDQELEKLLLHADGRPVTASDVQALVSRARETSIFDLVDAVGQRQADRALRLLHHILDDGEPALYILAMLARQIRILIQVKLLQERSLAQREVASRLKLHPYATEKASAQARNFTHDQLEAAHRELVKADWGIKTGQVEDVVALDLLVVALCRV
jgi:DNA polymerase-3 subunit delta